MIAYILSSAAWSLIGLIAGFMLGSTYREVHEIRETVVPHRIVDNHNVLGIIVIGLSVLTITGGAISLIGQRQIVECQANYNAEFNAVYRERIEFAQEDRQALVAMVDVIAESYDQPPEVGNAQVRAAIQQYVRTVEATEQQRRDNPLPDTPDPDSCR